MIRIRPVPTKSAIAASFSRAAQHYDRAAELQRDVGDALLARHPIPIPVSRWLDLGCGTGHFCRVLRKHYPRAYGIGADLSEGMLHHARREAAADAWLTADAERLPLHAASVDLVFSSLMLQWCADIAAALRNITRILRPGGIALLSSLYAGTLNELRDSWRQVDDAVHVNPFLDETTYRHIIARCQAEPISVFQETRIRHFGTLRALMTELKAIGAHNLNPGRHRGLTGRRRLAALEAAYETYRTPQGLPATYQVIYVQLRKPA